MYGRGNYAPPQFGQGLQRPMPPYQQATSGHLPPFQFQPGQPFMMQQGGPPHGGPPRGPGYPHVPPAPLNMAPHGPSNPSQSFVQRPMVHEGPPPQLLHPGGQPPQLPSFGPPRALPPPPLQRPNVQQGVYNVSLTPPPVPQAPTGFFPRPNFTPFPQQLSVGSQMKLPPQPPLLPPSSLPTVPNLPSSSLAGGSTVIDGDVPGQSQILESESTVMVKIGCGGESTLVSRTDLSLKESVAMELPPPPPKPADEAVLRNIEVLCQFIAKNGSQFEEMARKKESGNPKFSFLVGGEPGSAASCAREYYLWMKKKCGIFDLDNGQQQQNLSQMHADGSASAVLNSSAIMATVHSPTDLDVDMEDDITQTDKEPEVYTSVDDLKSETVSTEGVPMVQKQETTLLDARDSSSPLDSIPPLNSVLEALDDITKADKESEIYTSREDLKSEVVSTGVSDMRKHETAALTSKLPVKSEEKSEIKPIKSCGQLGKIDSPFGFIQDYASDDNSVDQLPPEHGDAETISPPPPPIFVTAGADSLLMKEETLAGQSETQGTLTIGCSSVKHESGDRYDTDDLSNPNTVFQGGYATKSTTVETAASKDIDRKDRKSTSTAVKVDEFGRLVKEGASDSESDGTQRTRRRGKRDRSRSRSRSPLDRRRRRSPFRRKSRRSRSRSWSPKKQRSRSRSPNRSRGDFGGEYLRRGKAQTQECFDFLKGRCYRGASCKYLHRDVGKSESSRRYKDKQYQADVVSARNPEFGYRVTSSVPLDYDDMKVEKMPYNPDKFDGYYLTTKTNDEKYKTESIDVVSNVLREDVQNPTITYKNIESHREDAAHVQGASGEHMSHLLIGREHPIFGMPSTGETIHRYSDEAPQEDNCDLPTVVGSGNSVSSLVETSVISPSGISTESYQGLASNEPTGPSASILNPPSQISYSPVPPLVSQTINAPQQSSGLVEYSSITPVSFPHLHVVPPYHAPLPIQQSHYPVPTTSGSASQFQQGSIPLRTDFQNQMSLRDQSGKLAGNSQVGGFQYQAYHLPPSNVSATPFVGASVVKDDRLSQFSSYGHGSAGTYTPGVPTQPGLFPGESNVTQSFPESNMLVGDASKQALHSHQFPHQRPQAFGLSLSASDSGPSHIGGSQSVSGQASDPLVREHPSHLVDVGQSRISAHYNPYASTFDQPLSSRFSSAFAQERVSTASVKYDSSFGLNRGSIEGLAVSGYGSRQILSSPNSSRSGGRMARLGGDQYDPLFDSIEPSSKRALNQDHAADNSDMLKGGNQQRALDVAENSKQKEIGAVLATASLDNDEYGETGDTEVGAVENGSLSDSDDDAIVAEGEIEIDHVNPGGDNKKSKDSRSMKLFKVAVANFVKEVLKPQWRQGNMSKEVFKTIVKKTVDKVSGTMKNHRVPKSQAKIDHYIDSSRRKLTQLVEGYVSKYKS